MPKRTSLNDVDKIDNVDDIENVVFDKRQQWRANNQKARRRQRRYKKRMVNELATLAKLGNTGDDHNT
jgi:hypothetical protein